MSTNTVPHADGAAKAAHSIQPSDISAYIDCVHAWLPRRLSARELAWLRAALRRAAHTALAQAVGSGRLPAIHRSQATHRCSAALPA